MNLDEKDSGHTPMICGILALAVLAVAGGLWLKHAFATTDKEAVAAVGANHLLPAAAQTPSAPSANATSGNAEDAQTESQLGAVMAQQNRTQDAIGHYRESVRLYHEGLRREPDSVERLNNLAWLLAANPFPEIRNGKEAVQLAKHACELTDWRKAVIVGTLGTAYAEAGQFDEAVKMAQKARVIALADGEPDVASKNEQLMALYQKRKPYHEAF